jgi:hypothetical protein
MTHRRAIRFTLLVLLCLLLGTLTTVGVAWFCQLRVADGTKVLNLDGPAAASHGWPPWAPHALHAPGVVVVLRAWGRTDERVFENTPRSGIVHQVFVQHVGWPMSAMWLGEVVPEDYYPKRLSPGWTLSGGRRGLQYVETYAAQRPGWTNVINVRWYLNYSGGNSTDTAVVCMATLPLWPGFAIDTILYAAAWWALLFTPLPLYRTARRRFRVSRGMCGACGYDLKGSPGAACPECGHAAGAKP